MKKTSCTHTKCNSVLISRHVWPFGQNLCSVHNVTLIAYLDGDVQLEDGLRGINFRCYKYLRLLVGSVVQSLHLHPFNAIKVCINVDFKTSAHGC